MPQMQNISQNISQKLLINLTELRSLGQNNIQTFILKDKELDLESNKEKKKILKRPFYS